MTKMYEDLPKIVKIILQILFGGIIVKDTKDFFASYDKKQHEKTR